MTYDELVRGLVEYLDISPSAAKDILAREKKKIADQESQNSDGVVIVGPSDKGPKNKPYKGIPMVDTDRAVPEAYPEPAPASNVYTSPPMLGPDNNE